jgi:hypothetical protein
MAMNWPRHTFHVTTMKCLQAGLRVIALTFLSGTLLAAPSFQAEENLFRIRKTDANSPTRGGASQGQQKECGCDGFEIYQRAVVSVRGFFFV